MEKQTYPNVPVYEHPREWKGHSRTLHRNYFLPINFNLEQAEKTKPMVGVGMTPLHLQCHLWVMHQLSQDRLGWSHQTWQITHPVQSRLTCFTEMRHSDHQEPTSLEVLKFWFVANTGPNQHLGCWVDLCNLPMCCDLSVCHFQETYIVEHTLLVTHKSAKHTHFTSRGTLLMQLLRWVPGQGREWTKGPFGPVATSLPEYK